jgi:2-hydroxychromene-2-carboxylate isomerase
VIKIYAEAIARAAGDPEWKDRRKAAEDAAIAYGAGKHTFGFTGLADMFGRDIAEKAAEWLDYRGGDPPEPKPPQADTAR